MDPFNEELNEVSNHIKTKEFKRNRNIYHSEKTAVILFKSDDGFFAGKFYKNGEFYKVVREYLLEYNMRNYNTIEPKCIFQKDSEYYLMTEYCLSLSDFFNFFPKDSEKENEEITFYKNLNILIIFTSLLITINSYHYQKISIIHHDLKPGNILLIPYQIENGELKKIEFDPKKFKYKPGIILIPYVFDFDYSKETIEKSNGGFTEGFRADNYYTELSDIFSLIVIFEMIINECTFFKDFYEKKDKNIKISKGMFTGFVTEFSFIDKSKLIGLEKIIDMMLTGYKNKDLNLLDIIYIFTTPSELRKYIEPSFIDDTRFDLFFDVLKMTNMKFDFSEEFKNIAQEIFGLYYKNFLFSMFHQKNNKFDIHSFQFYQDKIVDLYNSKTGKSEIFDEISNYNYDLNFFCFKKQIDEFEREYCIDAKSKLFLILKNMNFQNNRSLHYYTIALSYTISSISYERKYRLEVCFGKDYQAKIGFIILNSKSHDLAVYNVILLKIFDLTELLISWDDFISDIDLNIEFSHSDINLNDFYQFLELINFKLECTKEEYYQECERKFLSMINNDNKQSKLHEFIYDEYKNDAPFIIFIHYLALYEIKSEKIKREKNNTNCDYTITQSSLNNENDTIFTVPKDQNERIIFDLEVFFVICEIKDDIISQELIDQYQSYFPVIKILKSLNVCLYEFDLFLNMLYNENVLKSFMQIASNIDENSLICHLQLLETISYLSNSFYEIIFQNIRKRKVSNKEILKYVSTELVKRSGEKFSPERFKVHIKINSPFIFNSYGKIKYKDDFSLDNLINDFDATSRSKIALCLTQSLTFLNALPFKIQTNFFESVLIDQKTELPMIQMKFADEYDFEQLLIDYSIVIKKLLQEKDNTYLNIITNIDSSFLPIQNILNFFTSNTFDFSFKGTDLFEYRRFINEQIYTLGNNEKFDQFAKDLLGNSYLSVLDFLFKSMKTNSNSMRKNFVEEMIKIIEKSSLNALIDDKNTLKEILNLFNEYFEEDSYNFVHLLNQLFLPLNQYEKRNFIKYNKILDNYQYERKRELSEKTISHIYHMMNRFISPMMNANRNYIYFKVPKTKYDKDFKNLSKYRFYYSLKSALYYLCNYNDSDNLLPETLTIKNIYINEMSEAIVLPFQVDEQTMEEILKTVRLDNDIDDYFDVSKLKYSYAKYIPLKDEHIIKLMKIFGFDYTTDLNEIISNCNFLKAQNEMKIIKSFHDKLEELVVTDEYLIELAKRCNKLSPLFTHLLEKATYSTNETTRNKAESLLNKFRSIVEIDRKELEIIDKLYDKNSGEGTIFKARYKDEIVVFKELHSNLDIYSYLQKIINMLFILKSLDEESVNKFIINEIGFTNFGTIMKYYPMDLNTYLHSSHNNSNNVDFWHEFIYKFIEGIHFLHSNQIIHNDINPKNMLLDDDLNPLLCDLINIQYEPSFIQNIISTPKYTPKKIISLIHKDIYAFETTFLEIFKYINVNSPLIKIIIERVRAANSNRNKEIILESIDVYLKEMSKKENKFVLKSIKKNDINNEDENIIQCHDILYDEISPEDFIDIVNEIKLIKNKDQNFYITFYTSFSNKISKINLDKKEEHFIYIINQIDSVIKKDIESNWSYYCKKNNENLYSKIAKLIYQRFCLNGFIGIENDFLAKMIFCLYQIYKNKEINDYLFNQIEFIINLLDENKSKLAIMFYNLILPYQKPKSKILDKNIVLRLKSIRLNYSVKIGNPKEENKKIEYIKELISEILDILLKYEDKKNEFLNYLQCNDDQETNDNVISMIYYVFVQYYWYYNKNQLSLLFKKIEEYAEKSIIDKYRDLPSCNDYMKFLINQIDSKRRGDSKKLNKILKCYHVIESDAKEEERNVKEEERNVKEEEERNVKEEERNVKEEERNVNEEERNVKEEERNVKEEEERNVKEEEERNVNEEERNVKEEERNVKEEEERNVKEEEERNVKEEEEERNVKEEERNIKEEEERNVKEEEINVKEEEEVEKED